MSINLTPSIQSQIYMDKKDSYLLNMVEKLSPKIEVQNKQDDKKTDQQKDAVNNYQEKKEPFFKQSEFTYNSYLQDKNLNSNIGSTKAFFDTLSSAGGKVKEAS
jgi:hypothetical protein